MGRSVSGTLQATRPTTGVLAAFGAVVWLAYQRGDGMFIGRTLGVYGGKLGPRRGELVLRATGVQPRSDTAQMPRIGEIESPLVGGDGGAQQALARIEAAHLKIERRKSSL